MSANAIIKVPSTDIEMRAEELVREAPANFSRMKTNWAQAYQVAAETIAQSDDASISPALKKQAQRVADAAKEALMYRGAGEGVHY